MMRGVKKRGSGPGAESLEDLSDEELMARFQKGESEALNHILARYGKPLFGFLYRQTGSRERAEDAYQEVFVKVIRAAGNYESSSRFAAWLFTIARNVCIDLSRREKHRMTSSLDAAAWDDAETTRLELVADQGPDPEADLRATELCEALERALARLSPEQREVFLLRERSGLSFKEIARITNSPLNTVKTRMHYALIKLRELLVQEGVAELDG